MDILLIILSFIIVLTGVVGLLLPFIPGVPFAWLGFLLFAYVKGFSVISLTTVLIFLGLTVLTIIFDSVMPLLGAKKYKASKYGLMGSFLGVVFGFILMGPLGMIIGPFAGVILGELWAGRNSDEVWQSFKGVLFGAVLGGAIKLTILLIMFVIMVTAIF